MKKQTLGIAVLAFLLILSATAIVPNTGAEGTATIWTDKPDYYPGDTVTIFGAVFLPDNTVLIKVTRPDYSIDSWTVTSDAGGYFTTTYQLDGMTGTYLVLAIDPVTDQTLASTSFTDSIQSTLEGWDIEPPKIGWTTGNVKGWREDGWVPYHFKIKGLAKNTDYNIVIAVDYFLPDSSGTYYYNSTAGWYGIDAQRHWNYTWTYNDDNPMSGTSITPDMKVVATSGFYEAQYTWHVNTEERTELTLWWENHIAIGAHNWPGAKIHVRTAFGGHSDVPIEVVARAPSTTMTKLSAETITLGQSVTDTATVTDGGSFPVPTGTVTFYVGSSTTGPWTQFASKSLSGGTAYADYLPLAAGDYYFNVTYSGDSNYQPSKSDPATEHLVVTPAPSTTATVLNATEIVLGEGVRDTATVTGLGGSFPVPTGTVTFYVGSSTTGPWTQFASKSLSGGTAYADYLPLAAGDYYFNVTYSGDSNYQPSKSDPATEHLVVVIPVTRTQGFWATHTAITCSVFSDKLGGKIDIGTKPGHYKNITKCGDLMGAFWSSIPRKTDGTRRSAIDQARMILVQQLIAAILNHAAFGTPVPIDSVTGKDLITAGNLAYGGNDKAEMLRVAKLLDDFNKSGDGYPLPPWMTPPGPATPRESREMADRVFWDTL
jgi:hypothetical protein